MGETLLNSVKFSSLFPQNSTTEPESIHACIQAQWQFRKTSISEEQTKPKCDDMQGLKLQKNFKLKLKLENWSSIAENKQLSGCLSN